MVNANKHSIVQSKSLFVTYHEYMIPTQQYYSYSENKYYFHYLQVLSEVLFQQNTYVGNLYH